MYNLSTLIIATILCWTYLTSIVQSLRYGCDVQYCQYCTSYNFCGLCQNNFILMIDEQTNIPYCDRVKCQISHCATCYQDNVCQACNPGFGVTAQGKCAIAESVHIQCDDTCLFCKNETYCSLCAYGLISINGKCKPQGGIQVGNCVAYFSPYICQLCQQGYAVNPAYQCNPMNLNYQCNITNCKHCDSNNTCEVCALGFQQINGKCNPLTCDVHQCYACNTTANYTNLCSSCQTGYFLNKTSNKCIPLYMGCNVENCIACTEPQLCTICQLGYLYTPVFNEDGYFMGSTCQLIKQEVLITPPSTQDYIYYPVTNCKIYDYVVPGTSIFKIACDLCESGFINVGGYCVANLTLSSYQCNIPNCAYCISDNYCGLCQSGYVAYIGNNQKCVPYYSSHERCKLTGLFYSYCAICEQGYIQQGDALQCLKYWQYGTCKIQNCSYCLTENQCSQCLPGFNLNNNTCQPKCDIDNCYQCANSSACNVCQVNYTLQNDGTLCKSKGSQQLDDCSMFSNVTTNGSACTNCTILGCNQCGSEYILYGGKCFEKPQQNIYGCAQYQSQVSNFCILCQRGFNLIMLSGLNFGDQCINVPCKIDNCAYCFSNTTCTLCMQGFTLNAQGNCDIFISQNCSENCIQCNDDNNCILCESGYNLYQGQCVCPFQNCLKCNANAFCSVCAYPLAATALNNAGCLPQLFVYKECNISNCYLCYSSTACSQCNNGYSLQPNGTCLINTCNMSNCLLCNPKNTLCFLCQEGYYQLSLYNATCEKLSPEYAGCLVDGCQLCQTQTTCSQCANIFRLGEDKQCYRYNCSNNCLICNQDNSCDICLSGYYRSREHDTIICLQSSQTSENCSDIKGCIKCQRDEINICITCFPGLQPVLDGLKCEPQTCNVDNCQLCNLFSEQICTLCEQGYALDPYFNCIKFNPSISTPVCDVYACLYCSDENFCMECLFGWVNLNGTCIQDTFCDIDNCQYCTNKDSCQICQKNYGLVGDFCKLQCTVDECVQCLNTKQCKICQGDLVPTSNYTSCQCPDTFERVENTTSCECPINYTVYEGACISCNIEYCIQCFKPDVCRTCSITFQNQNNQCVCPDTFNLQNGSCVCTNGTIQYQGKCIQCTIQYCQQCTSQNQCGKCINNLTLTDDNTCQCPDSFNITDEYCLCPSGYQPYNDTCYECTLQNCAYCLQDNECGGCVNNLILQNSTSCGCQDGKSLYNSYCYTCNDTLVPNCQICNSTNYCSNCTSTFRNYNGTCECGSGYRQYEGTCIQCGINNCSSCSSINNCTQCQNGYTLNSNTNICILCNIDNCTSCSSQNYCSSCQNSLVPNSFADSCVICNISNCQSCSSNNICNVCSEGYQFGLTNRNCYRCFIDGCDICSSDNKCSVCERGYNLNTTDYTCFACSTPCSTCNINGGCLTCLLPYSLSAASNGTCFKCTATNCLQCHQNDTLTCIECASGYILNSTNLCQYQCEDLNCQKCSTPSKCQRCIAGYTFGNSTTCSPCNGVPQCAECSPTNADFCTKCSSGFYSQSGKCNACPYPYCDSCTSSGCITYKKDSGFFPIVINGKSQPAVCDFNCLSCSPSNPQKCLECQDGFTIVDGLCLPCKSRCKTCASDNLAKCYSCYSNANLYTDLQNNYCHLCDQTCLTCSKSNSDICTSCPVGSYLTSSGQCIGNCPNNCQYCSNSTVCTVCLQGFTTNSIGQCVPCLSNCRQCSSGAPAICLNCGTGFYLLQNTCTSCSSNCTKCNANGCSQCRSGYYLTSSFTCAAQCTFPCASCSSQNSNTCYSCVAGYTYNQQTNKCQQISCKNNCQVCPATQILIDGSCIACNTQQTCSRCSSTNTSKCLSCFKGYYLNSNNSCVVCPSGCSSCSSANNCLSCTSSYVSTIQSSSNSPTTCQPCQFPCATCFNNPQTCLTCATNYTLSGWKCLTKFNFGFQVELNTNLETFYNNYYNFLESISDVFNSTNVAQVSMSSIRQGSVIAQGNASLTKNTVQNNSMLNETFTNFTNLFAKGGSIAGMSIINSKVIAVGGTIPDDNDDDNSSSGPNLALILGICIPVGLILIGVIIYFVCIYRKKSKPPVSYPEPGSNNVGPPPQDTTVRQTFELSKSEYNE